MGNVCISMAVRINGKSWERGRIWIWIGVVSADGL